MKRILKIAAMALVIVLGSSLRNTASAQYNDSYDNQYQQGDRDVSYQTFYDELSPHGRWVDYPGQGYVWVPDAGPDFRPYSTNGRWVWSDNYEWMWVSDYDWGWAPFHYGRWDNDPSYGWYWVPGYEWSPAWVAWRDGGDYYGWAPIRPGININVNFNIGGYAPPVDFWSFAPRRYITSPRIYDYYADRRQNVTIINYTTIIINTNSNRYNNHYGFRSGPRRYDAERYCGTINPVRFRAADRPGRADFRNNQVSIFRPNVRRDDNRTFSPRSFERYDRNSNTGFRRNETTNNRNNTGPVRRDGDVTTRNDRRNEVVRQPGNNNNNDNRRFERNGNTDQPNRNGDGRVMRPSEVPDRNPNSGNPNRRFERRDENTGSTNTPVRVPETRRNDNGPVNRNGDGRVFQPAETPDRNPNPGNNNRRFERRENNTGTINTPPVRQPQVERRQEQRQAPQVERRQEQRQAPQVERRPQTQPVERRQEQPRQFERRDNGNRQPVSNSGNSESRNGRKRF